MSNTSSIYIIDAIVDKITRLISVIINKMFNIITI